MREKGQTEVAKTLETPVFSRGIEILTEKLELNPEYQLVSYEMPDKPSERLSSTLGELFAGLDLRFT